MSGRAPLDGVRVADFTWVWAGPFCTLQLAHLGAEVIRVESATRLCVTRLLPPFKSFEPGPNRSGYFNQYNQGKRSITLDLKRPEAIEVAKRLCAASDIVVENFAAGVMDRMGLGYEDCRALNPRIVYAVGTGFGETGPYAHKGGQDVLAQAMSGVMARKADPSHPLATYATALADYSAGMHMVQGILLALLQRAQTGVGQKISVSLYNSMLAMQMQEAAMILMRDREVNWAAMPLSGVFECADHPLVLVGAFKANPLRDICAALELPDLSLEPRFANLEQQFAHKGELQGLLRERFRTRPRDHWLARLEAQDLLCAPVRDMREVLVDPQTVHNAMVMEGPAAAETRYRFIASPITMSAAPVALNRVPPRLGEHTEEVLAEAAAATAKGRP